MNCNTVFFGTDSILHTYTWFNDQSSVSVSRQPCSTPSAMAPLADAGQLVYKLQGGTGKHVDGDVANPLQGRPFQALVQLTPAAENDGSLTVLPGFHSTAVHFFEKANLPTPAGGFSPLTLDQHADLMASELWVPVRRVPKRWKALHKAGRCPAPSNAAQARGRDGIIKALRLLAGEVRADLHSAELPQPGEALPAGQGLTH